MVDLTSWYLITHKILLTYKKNGICYTVFRNGYLSTNIQGGQKMKKLFSIIVSCLVLLSFISCSKQNENVQSQAKQQLTAPLKYEVIRDWKTGGGQVGMDIYVEDFSSKESVKELAKFIQNNYDLGVVKIYKNRDIAGSKADKNILLFVLKNEIRDMDNW